MGDTAASPVSGGHQRSGANVCLGHGMDLQLWDGGLGTN